jgi:Zn-dependent protease with chaperone function
VQHGEPNAFLYKLFRTKFIVLHSDFIEAGSREEIYWLVARFVASLKAKHDRLTVLSILVSVSEKFVFMNLFLYPYERAVVYTADQLALYLSGDLRSALLALNRMVVGKDLHHYVAIEGLEEQRREIDRSLLAWLVRISSTHPHIVDRHANLFRFAQEHMPEALIGYDRNPPAKPKPIFGSPPEPVEVFSRAA